IYTTDYFQQSAFNLNDQIISIYYFVEADISNLQVKTKLFDFELHQIADAKGQSEVLRWVDWNDLNEDTVSLPIDKIVVRMLKELIRW
ncbi:MAG TPA: NUDIX hydrolase, partial [Parafilimonas sp.]